MKSGIGVIVISITLAGAVVINQYGFSPKFQQFSKGQNITVWAAFQASLVPEIDYVHNVTSTLKFHEHEDLCFRKGVVAMVDRNFCPKGNSLMRARRARGVPNMGIGMRGVQQHATPVRTISAPNLRAVASSVRSRPPANLPRFDSATKIRGVSDIHNTYVFRPILERRPSLFDRIGNKITWESSIQTFVIAGDIAWDIYDHFAIKNMIEETTFNLELSQNISKDVLTTVHKEVICDRLIEIEEMRWVKLFYGQYMQPEFSFKRFGHQLEDTVKSRIIDCRRKDDDLTVTTLESRILRPANDSIFDVAHIWVNNGIKN